jgi:hypothetical protein
MPEGMHSGFFDPGLFVIFTDEFPDTARVE